MEFNDPIISIARKGTSDSPFQSIEESLIVDSSAKVQLTEYPHRYNRVIVTGDSKDWYETDSTIPDESSYHVDYLHKIVTFNIANIGKQLQFKYEGVGKSLISANNIYTERDGLDVVDTLQTLTDTTKDARDSANQTNENIQQAENVRVQNENTRKSEHAAAMNEVDQTITTANNRIDEVVEDTNTMIADTSYIEPYNATTTYKRNNVVSFNGHSFIAKQGTKGNPPPDPEVANENAYWGLAARKGADGTGTVKTPVDTFTATEGQKVFTLRYTYDQFQGRTKVTVGGVPQFTPEHYEETTSKTITLNEGVPAGTIVKVEYFSESVPLQSDIQNTVDNHTGVISDHASRLNNHDTELNSVTTQLAQRMPLGEAVIFNDNSTLNDYILDVANLDEVFLRIDKCFDSSVRVYGHNDKIGEQSALTSQQFLVSLSSNISHKAVTVPGYYKVDVRTFVKIRINKYQSNNGNQSDVSLSVLKQTASPIAPNEVVRSSNSLPVMPTVASFNKTPYIHCIKNNWVYASLDNKIAVTKDFGVDDFATTVYTFTDTTKRIKRIQPVGTTFLVLTSDGKLYRTTDNFATLTEVMDFLDKSPHDLFGISVYKNVVVLTEYRQISLGGSSKAFVSTDSGATFTEFFELTNYYDGTNYHTHHCAYDPIEGMFWMCVGDGEDAQQIYYNKTTDPTKWRLATPRGLSVTQATMVIPLRDCVLFASDSRLTSVIRYNRPKSGTPDGGYLDFETAWIIKERWGADNLTEVPIASTCAIDYTNNLGYFGFGLITNAASGSTGEELKYGDLFVTNGYDYKIVKTPYSAGSGVWGVWADFESSPYVLVKCNQNVGYIYNSKDETKSLKGTSTILKNQNSTWIDHNLGYVPHLSDIVVTPTSTLGNAKNLYVDTLTTQGFAVRNGITDATANPNTNDITFAWRIDK